MHRWFCSRHSEQKREDSVFLHLPPFNLAFGCSHEKKNSADAALGKYSANATDGGWHEVRIPLQDSLAARARSVTSARRGSCA
jgi:hypothetical protein